MPNYRRAYITGGTYFFTLKTENSAPIFIDDGAVTLLGNVFREAKSLWPFDLDALVLLPDHLHAIWTLRHGDDTYSKRWAWIKKEFTKLYLASGGHEQRTSMSARKHRRRGVW